MWEMGYAFMVLSEYSIIFQKKNENTSQFPKKKKKKLLCKMSFSKGGNKQVGQARGERAWDNWVLILI